MILADTHVLIWFTHGDHALGVEARRVIERHVGEQTLAISPISFWEAAMLSSKGRVRLLPDLQGWCDTLLSSDGVQVLPVTPRSAMAAGALGDGLHGDPADRILIATALANNCPLLTADRPILDYGAAGHVDVVDARW